MSSKTILVCGYGPGISDGVARRFAAEGFQVALVARSAERAAKAAMEISGTGAVARAFQCDLGDPVAVRALVKDVRQQLGPITVVHWNALAMRAGDLLSANESDLRAIFDVGVNGLVVAVQAAHEDLRAQRGTSAVLITGGGFANYDAQVDQIVVTYQAMGLSLVKAAQRKLAGILHARLKPEGIYVGEVVVLGAVAGTAFDPGNATLQPATVADAFWKLYTGRTALSASVSG